MFARRHPAISRRVSLTLKTGHALSGVLVETTGAEFLTLKDVLYHEDRPDTPARRLDGEVIVDRVNVDFVQILPPLPPPPTPSTPSPGRTVEG